MPYAEMRGVKMSKLENPISIIRKELRASVDEHHASICRDEEFLLARISKIDLAVKRYHASKGRQWVSFTEFEERLRRVEQHLKLPQLSRIKILCSYYVEWNS